MTARHAYVIGASSGIGAATAFALAEHGWAVTAAARRQQRLTDIATANPNIRTVTLDASDGPAVRRAIGEAPPIDVLVYSAGWNLPDRELDVLAPDDWTRSFLVNVDGAFHATQAVLPQMRESGGGLIVFVSSISAERADASGAAYQASKRALHGLAEATSLEEGPHGIRTSLIMPGLTRTEFNELRRTPPTEAERRAFMSPEDVASAIVFVCQLPAHMMVPYLTVVPTANPWNR